MSWYFDHMSLPSYMLIKISNLRHHFAASHLNWSHNCPMGPGPQHVEGGLWAPLTLGRIPLSNRIKFWKNSKRPLAPSFLKNYVANLFNGYGCIYARRYEGQIVWNACTCLLQSVSCFDFSQYNCWKNIPWTPKLLFWINFLLKKPCSQYLQYNFLDKNDP